MNIIVFGATGRVGACIVEQAVQAGHRVTAFVRNSRSLKGSVQSSIGIGGQVAVEEGNVLDPSAVRAALQPGFDAVINAIGESGLKRSTIVTDSVTNIVAAMQATGNRRFLGVSGTAEMAQMTSLGKLTIAILRMTPVAHAIRDHDGALARLKVSGLRWMLAGCGYIKTGPRIGHYRTSLILEGGFKIIHPPDVADLIVRELTEEKYTGNVVGIWY
jgi:putative NADH-flavin reductase